MPATALPRFAARNGMECIQCHVNPTGGGMRNAYGRNVFENAVLPRSTVKEPDTWLAQPFPVEGEESPVDVGRRVPGFSPDLTEWLAIGADVRLAHIFIRPDKGPTEDTKREITNSFFLMQGDLYHSARIGEAITLYLDVGVYSGFEAWGLFRLLEDGPLYLKAGRFLPGFGIREVEHQLFTREGIGFGATDRDTGLELTYYLGPLTTNLGVFNGTLGDTAFDASGKDRRTFEKAVVARASVRGTFGLLRGQVGGSFYWDDNSNQPNPLLAGSVPSSLSTEAARGVAENRVDAFVTANLGRFTYLGDIAAVRDRFSSPEVPKLTGYATYQELSFIATQGVEFIGTFEHMDPDIEVLRDARMRAGLVVEVFPFPFVELRAMVRRSWGGEAPTGGQWDTVVFLHLFM